MNYVQTDKTYAPTTAALLRDQLMPVKQDGDCDMPAIPREIAQLDRATNQLAATVADLLKRMQPVLVSAPTEASAAPTPVPSVSCPVSDSISMMTARVWAQERALRVALDHLQV